MGVADRETRLPSVSLAKRSGDGDVSRGNTSVPRDLACGILLPYRLPISYLRWLPSPAIHLAVVAFLGTLSGSYWYAVFRSPLRPTSRDNSDCTHMAGECQRGFGDLSNFLTKGSIWATDANRFRMNGGSPFRRVSTLLRICTR